MSNTTNPDSGAPTSPEIDGDPDLGDVFSESGLFREFVILLIPVYYFLLIGFLRICYLSRSRIVTLNNPLQNSFKMKCKTNLIMVFVYIMQFIMASIQKTKENDNADYHKLGFLYLLGATAWYMSSKLLVLEAERGNDQGFFTLRIFWIAEFIFACVKLSYPLVNTTWPFVIHLIQISVGFVQFLYAMAKPYDTEKEEEEEGEESHYGDCMRNILMYIESLFFDEEERKKSWINSKELPLLYSGSRRPSERYDYVNEFQDFVRQKHPSIYTKKDTNGNANKAKPFPKVPEVQCKITRNEVREQGETDVKILYEVKTTIEGRSYVKLHKYANFLDLQEYIAKQYIPSKAFFVDTVAPKLETVDFNDFEDESAFLDAREKAIEEFMGQLVRDPRYLNDIVVEFLGIHGDHKAAFAAYSDFLKNSISKSRALHYFKQPLVMMGESSQFKKKAKMPLFSAYCSHYQKKNKANHYEYVFVVKDQNDPHTKPWNIVKTFGEFKLFHEELQKTMNANISFFDQNVPKPSSQTQTTDPEFLNKRKIGLEKYFDLILANRKYYKAFLYEFVEYNKKESLSSKFNTPRGSFFGEETKDGE